MLFPEEMAQIQDETRDPGSVTFFLFFAGNCVTVLERHVFCVFPLVDHKIAT